MTVQAQRSGLSLLWVRMAENISENYLELFLITSQAAGLEPSEGRPLGAGKSTLGLTIVYRAFAFENGTLYIDLKKGQIIDETPEEEKIRLMKEVVEKYTFWKLSDLLLAIKTAPKRLPAVLWDDAQLDCPAWTNIPQDMREKIEELSVVRPLVANIVITAPSISDLAKPLRRQINWEVIIPRRGTYEVHFIGKRRNFYQPTEDMSRLWYDATGSFDPLPGEVMQLYDRRREEVARRLERLKERKPSFEEKVLDYYKRGYPPRLIANNLHCKISDVMKVIEEMRRHTELINITATNITEDE
jgi:predicted CopG family antitoxin